MQESLDAIKPSRGVRDFQCCVREQAKCADPDNISQVQPFEGCIVGKI
jgi:hypothetical protein